MLVGIMLGRLGVHAYVVSKVSAQDWTGAFSTPEFVAINVPHGVLIIWREL